MTERGKWDGMLAIARFNWPFYLTAGTVLAVSIVVMLVSSSRLLEFGCGLIAAGCLWFLIGSLGVSHWIYDGSDLYKWKWLEALSAKWQAPVSSVAYCHSGFDEASSALRKMFPHAIWNVLDHHDPVIMKEASIRRARKLYPPFAETISCAYNAWPLASGTSDVIFGILAIHEFRTHLERVAWFSEARRCLNPSGRVILVEHTRDLANFMAFGPGFLHFHSVRSWVASWESAGLVCETQIRVTPFVGIYSLKGL